MDSLNVNRMTLGAFAAFLAILIGTMISHILVMFEYLRPAGRKGAFVAAAVHILAIAFAAVVVPWLRRLAGTRRDDGPGRGRRFWPGVALAFLACWHPATRLVGMEHWLGNNVIRFLVIAGIGIAVAIAYYLFFTFTPHGKRGVLFGIGIAGGIGARYAVELLVREMERQQALAVVFDIVLWLSLILAAAELIGLECLPKGGAEPPGATPEPVREKDPRLLRRLLGATALFFLINGFQSGRLFPFMGDVGRPQTAILPLAVMAFAALAGWLLDRDWNVWFGRIMAPCALVFMLTPALGTMSVASPEIYNVVQPLAVVGNFMFFVCASVTLERFGGRGTFWCLQVLAPHFTRTLAFAWMVLDWNGLRLGFGVKTVLSILAALAFYELVRPSRRDAKTAEPKRSAPTPQEEEPHPQEPEPDAGQPRRRSTTVLFKKHRLTDREAEVAELLLKGMSTADMAKKLFISEVTVKFHVKNILGKFNVGTRRVFQAKAFSGELWNEADDSPGEENDE